MSLSSHDGSAAFDPRAVADEVSLYPLPAALEGRRKALVLGLQARRPARTGGRPRGWNGAPALTCVIADVHANLPALEAVLAEAGRRGAAAFLFLGDAVGYGPHPRECIARIAELESALVVRGNHDEAAAHRQSDLGMNRLARATAGWTWGELTEADRSGLAAMPVEHAGEGWLAVHGAPVDPRRFVAYVYDLTYEDNLACLARQGRTLCLLETADAVVFVSGSRRETVDDDRQCLAGTLGVLRRLAEEVPVALVMQAIIRSFASRPRPWPTSLPGRSSSSS